MGSPLRRQGQSSQLALRVFQSRSFLCLVKQSCEAKALLRVLDLWLSHRGTPQDPRPQLLELKIRTLGLEMAGQRARRRCSVLADVYMISLRAVCLLSRERRELGTSTKLSAMLFD